MAAAYLLSSCTPTYPQHRHRSSSCYYLSSKTAPRLLSPICSRRTTKSFSFSSLSLSRSTSRIIPSASSLDNPHPSSSRDKKQQEIKEDEVEEELPWIQDKALDLVEFTGSVTQAIPGPRVARTQLPWALAIPLAYIGFTFAFSLFKTFRNFTSPRHARRNLVNKNAVLCKSIDELFEKGTDGVHQAALEELLQKTGFSMVDIVRKYIRYALNEKPFNLDFVSNLIQLRKAASLDDSDVAEIINDISRKIVKDRGPVVMDMSGYSEKGFNRKLAVKALFKKVYYLSELPKFCARDSSLIVKEIFGVTDEDAEKLRLHTLSDGDVDSLEKLVEDSEIKDSDDGSSNAR